MTDRLEYRYDAARRLIERRHWEMLASSLMSARDEVLTDVALSHAGGTIPVERRPIDAGFLRLPEKLLAEHDQEGDASLLGRIRIAAEEFRERVDRVVLLGIGGSYMGARALFEALCHPLHNELPRAARDGTPRLYFQGDNVDNDAIRGLLELLATEYDAPIERPGRSERPGRLAGRWGVTVISKSGGTLETAAAFRIFRDALETRFGIEEARKLVVPVTGETGRLRDLANAAGYPHVFPIPDDVGGRFSIFTAVGLFPAAVLGLDVVALLEGAAAMNERFVAAAIGENPVLDYVAVGRGLEEDHGLHIRVLATWGARLEAVGLWYDQLLAESLGKEEQGPTPITVVNTRDLHSRGQQHQEGARDKLITNLYVERPATEPIPIPTAADDRDGLNRLAGKTVPDLLAAAFEGTNRAYAEADRPTADIILPRLDEFTLGELFQMLMLATVTEGRLIGINPYGQPGVEAYKRKMAEILKG
ncbi:MAG: glucose-6-phosphate isomerase [Planctomycetaceae bacterium]